MKNLDLPKIVRERLLFLGAEPDDRCLVALSGGQDSTALFLAMVSGWGGRGLTVAAHLDHAVRQGSEKDMVMVRNLCDQLDIELKTARLDPETVWHTAKRNGSLESAMRTYRYEFLMSCVELMGAKWLLTGHTADDQVETVLFRIFRGMNPMALSGIPEKRLNIMRPLLGITRNVTRRYCMEKGIEPLEDPSNHDYRFARNSIRYRTIPVLKSTFHPDLDRLVLRLAALTRSMEAAESTILYNLGIQEFESEQGALSTLQFIDLPGGMRQSAVGRFLHMSTGKWPSTSQLLEAVEHLYGRKRGRMSLPGGKIMDSSSSKIYIYNIGHHERPFIPLDPVHLPVPGNVSFETAGVTIKAEYGVLAEVKRIPGGDTALIRRKSVREPLWVRRRHPGDRFSPLGMDGAKKMKNFLIDRKIPQRERDGIPLILDNEGEILWVAGVEISQKAALEGCPGEETVVLRMERTSD